MFPAAAAYRTELESYESEEGDDAAISTGDTLCETESPISESSQLPPCSRSEPSSSQSSGATSTPLSAHHDVPEHVVFRRQARHRASVSGCHHAKRPCKHGSREIAPRCSNIVGTTYIASACLVRVVLKCRFALRTARTLATPHVKKSAALKETQAYAVILGCRRPSRSTPSKQLLYSVQGATAIEKIANAASLESNADRPSRKNAMNSSCASPPSSAMRVLLW